MSLDSPPRSHDEIRKIRQPKTTNRAMMPVDNLNNAEQALRGHAKNAEDCGRRFENRMKWGSEKSMALAMRLLQKYLTKFFFLRPILSLLPRGGRDLLR